jgi:YggT family protein
VAALSFFLTAVQLLILARVILSWVASPVSRQPLVVFIRSVTEPILAPVRSILPGTGPVDFSPMLVLFVIYLLQRAIGG